MPVPELRVIPVTGVPEVKEGDDVGRLLAEAAARQGTPLQTGDVLVVTQKIVSKAEGCVVRLDSVTPSEFAIALAKQWEKDPRQVEVVLRESKRIVRMDRGVIITETKHGFICANSGVDASNIADMDSVSLLPADPDASARGIRQSVQQHANADVAVLISDSFGRPWRMGITNVAIGVAGMDPLRDERGKQDAYGRLLQTTMVALADELVSAMDLVSQKANNIPAGVVRGFPYERTEGSGRALLRDAATDLFR
ncbi:MAG: coenzyme F420-0:L-glutamate ligase [Dehalococcoidia bacterium]|nr:coenzyme F420-0:L-glutamate ligase [Dehalococcoidia bacterium]